MTETSEFPAFPMARECPFKPPEAYAKLRGTEPVSRVAMPTGQVAWVLTRHEDVRMILNHPDVSADRLHPSSPRIREFRQDEGRKVVRNILSKDPPEHTEHRRMLIGEFTLKRLKDLRPRIQEITDECVDAMLAAPERPVDLVEALSLPVPSLVICELLGVPYADHDFFQSRTAKLINLHDAEEARKAFDELAEYFEKLIDRQEQTPGDDLIGRTIVKYREAGTYDHDEMVNLATILLVAGHETTANMISLGVVGLLENPEQLLALKFDSSLLPTAVEELLRYFSIADWVTSRVALKDIEICGVTIRAGEGIIGLGAAANRDDTVFAEPDRLDITRHARQHVAFGYGAHQCLGQNLARMELEIVYETLFRRIPGLRLAVPADKLPYKDNAAVYGIHEVPVTW